jgi:hypothetical protein
MNLFFTLVLILFFACNVSAQFQTCISYDQAGNRVQRSYCCTNCLIKSPSFDTYQSDAMEVTELVLAPNPSDGVFRLLGVDSPPESQVIIVRSNGQVLANRTLGDAYFDLSDQPSGVYYLQLHEDRQRIKTIKFEIVKP